MDYLIDIKCRVLINYTIKTNDLIYCDLLFILLDRIESQ